MGARLARFERRQTALARKCARAEDEEDAVTEDAEEEDYEEQE